MDKLKPFKFLYVEDDELIRKGYINYFKTIFENVYESIDGEDAYNLFQEYRPDIILCDINLPKLNGLELIEKIRKVDKDVKIIILTAHADKTKLLQAIPLNLINYLVKPVKKRDLDDVIFEITSDLELNDKDKLRLSNNIYFDKKKNILIDNNTEVNLTKNEIILINILSSKSKANYSLDDILEEFWQFTSQKEMSYDSIRNIIKRLKLKLPEGSIINNYAVGYKFAGL